MRMTTNEIQAVLVDACLKVDLPGWEERISITWPSKMKRAMGYAKYATNTIKLSPHLFDRASREEQTNTIIHELCHLLDNFLYGNRGHKKTWKSLMVKCGQKPTRCHNIDRTGLRNKKTRFEAQCSACHQTLLISAHSATKIKKGQFRFHKVCGENAQIFLTGKKVVWKDQSDESLSFVANND